MGFLRKYGFQDPRHDLQSEGPQRLVKYIADRCALSRRQVDCLIQKEGAMLNGQIVYDPALTVCGALQIVFQNKILSSTRPNLEICAYDKPAGMLTSRFDPQGRPCLFDCLPPCAPSGLLPVGRLDFMTEGLLLLTNNGDFKRFMEHPKNHIPRTYQVWFKGKLTEKYIKHAAFGLVIEGIQYRPCQVIAIKNGVCQITLTEGKNREIRRMMAFWGLQVTRLVRLCYGPFGLS